MRASCVFSSIALLSVVLLGLAGLAPAAHAAGPGGDVFLGYSRLGNDTFYSNVGGLNGWDLDGQIKWRRHLGVEGDVAHYGLGAPSSTPRTTAVLFGPRLTVGTAGIHIFVHGLLGGEHSSNSGGPVHISGGAMAVAFGGGVDVRIAPSFAWRLAADYLNAPTETPGSGSHDRFTTGLVFRF